MGLAGKRCFLLQRQPGILTMLDRNKDAASLIVQDPCFAKLSSIIRTATKSPWLGVFSKASGACHSEQNSSLREQRHSTQAETPR